MTMWYWHQGGQIDQWNRAGSPEIDLHICWQLIFDKSGNAAKLRNDNVFNKDILQKNKKPQNHTAHHSQKLTQNEP